MNIQEIAISSDTGALDQLCSLTLIGRVFDPDNQQWDEDENYYCHLPMHIFLHTSLLHGFHTIILTLGGTYVVQLLAW